MWLFLLKTFEENQFYELKKEKHLTQINVRLMLYKKG